MATGKAPNRSPSPMSISPTASDYYPHEFRVQNGNQSRHQPPKAQNSIPKQRYVSIQPKPLPVPGSQSAWPHRRCRVKLCVDPRCNLRSHRQFAMPRKSKPQPRQEIELFNDDPENQPWSAVTELIPKRPQYAQLPLSPGGAHGLPELPLEGLDEPLGRHLFHYFFGYDYDRIRRVLLPPPYTKFQKQVARETKRVALAKALSAPVYCFHYVAAAHLTLSFRRENRHFDRNTNLLHGKVMTLLRQKLNDFVQEEVQDVLTVIFTLCMFEVSSGRTKSLSFHRDATIHLVRHCGGIHNIKRALPIFLTLDRMLSMFTDMPPIYSPPPNQFIRKPPQPPFTYGSYLEQAASHFLLGGNIHQYCYDICRAIEILEREGWSFDPNDPPIPDSPHVHYFYFLRDCILNDFVRHNVSTAKDKTVARCVLLAAKIVEYNALLDNYLVFLPHGIGNKVQDVLCAEDSEIRWHEVPAVLHWILFVLTTMFQEWEGHLWAMGYLRQQLEIKYNGSIWPINWRQHELDNLHCFVWSDTRLNARFTKICTELQFTSASALDFQGHQIEQI